MDEGYVEKSLEDHAWQHIPLTYGRSFSSSAIMQSTQTSLLIEQKRVLDGIAKAGKDCVIVGMERAAEGENLTPKALEQNIRRVDKARARSREMISDTRWGQGSSYRMTMNTTGWDLKELTAAVADFVRRWYDRGGGKVGSMG